jgi:hypothetical protein
MLRIPHDLVRYRQQYPGETINNRQMNSNVKFYQNQIKSVPDGTYHELL